MDHSEELQHGVDDEDNNKKLMASSTTMPIPPNLPNPMKTNNLLSRLQNFLPQLEAANRALETEAAGANTSLSGSNKRRTIDIDLCRQSEDESSSSSSDSSDDDSSAADENDDEGNDKLDSKSESNLLTPVASTSKRRREDEATITSKRIATNVDDHVEAFGNGGGCSKDGINAAVLPKAGAATSTTNLGDLGADRDGDVPTHHHQDKQEEESDQPMIQIQFVMGSNLEEQHPAAMALLADNDGSDNSSSDDDDDEDSDSSSDDDNEPDDDHDEPVGDTADSKPRLDRLSKVKQLLQEQSTPSYDKKTGESKQSTSNTSSKPLITELD